MTRKRGSLARELRTAARQIESSPRATELSNPRSSALRLLKDSQRGVLQVISGAQKIDHGSDRTSRANWNAAVNALQEAQKKIKYAISQLA